MADGIRGVRSLKWEGGGVGMKWLVMLSRLNFFTLSPAKETFFLRSLNNMLVSFRVKDSSQTASNSPCSVYSGVAVPAVGVSGGVTVGPFTLWPPKISSVCESAIQLSGCQVFLLIIYLPICHGLDLQGVYTRYQ